MSSQTANKLNFVNQAISQEQSDTSRKLAFVENALKKEEPESEGKYLARGAAQIGKGIAKATIPGLTMEIAHAIAPSIMATPAKRREELEKPSLLRKTRTPEEIEKELAEYKKHYETYQEWAKNMPTIERLSQLGEEYTGLPLSAKYKEQEPLELVGGISKLASGELAKKAFTGTAAGATTSALQAAGVPQPVADIAATIASPENVLKTSEGLIPKTAEKLPSGLTKPRAIEAKYPKLAVAPKGRKAEKIQALNEEAGKLSKEILEKRLPISKKIEEGFDFKKQFDQQFGKIQKLAEDFRPQMDISPLDDFLKATEEKYYGIPNPHEDAKLIKTEINKLKRSSYDPNDLANQLKIYRSNNKKKYEIFEKARTEGKKTEYVDWLTNYNNAIRESMKKTFPENSPFVKLFEESNRDFSEHLRALDANEKLKTLIGGNPSPRLIAKLSDDPKTINKLSLSMGKEGAQEISQIAKDLKLAKESIKNIPTNELKKFDAILPLGVLLDVTGISHKVLSAYSATKLAQYGYGRFLMSSKNRKAYSDAIESIIKKDPRAYSEAISHFDNEEE